MERYNQKVASNALCIVMLMQDVQFVLGFGQTIDELFQIMNYQQKRILHQLIYHEQSSSKAKRFKIKEYVMVFI